MDKIRGLGSGAAVQGVVHRRDDLVDLNRAVAVRVTRHAAEERDIAWGDVHHRDEFVHGADDAPTDCSRSRPPYKSWSVWLAFDICVLTNTLQRVVR